MAGEEEGRDKFHGATRRVVVGEKRRHENGREGKDTSSQGFSWQCQRFLTYCHFGVFPHTACARGVKRVQKRRKFVEKNGSRRDSNPVINSTPRLCASCMQSLIPSVNFFTWILQWNEYYICCRIIMMIGRKIIDFKTNLWVYHENVIIYYKKIN